MTEWEIETRDIFHAEAGWISQNGMKYYPASEPAGERGEEGERAIFFDSHLFLRARRAGGPLREFGKENAQFRLFRLFYPTPHFLSLSPSFMHWESQCTGGEIPRPATCVPFPFLRWVIGWGKGETRGGRKGVFDLLLPAPPLRTEEKRGRRREKPASSHELPGKRCCMRTGGKTALPHPLFGWRRRGLEYNANTKRSGGRHRGGGAAQINLTPN